MTNGPSAAVVQMMDLCEFVLSAQSSRFSPTAFFLLAFIFSVWPHALSTSRYSKPAMNTDLLFSCHLCPFVLVAEVGAAGHRDPIVKCSNNFAACAVGMCHGDGAKGDRGSLNA